VQRHGFPDLAESVKHIGQVELGREDQPEIIQ
jgi:hypothetical protein